MVYHNEDGSITSNAAPRTMIGENAIIAAKDAEIARLQEGMVDLAMTLNKTSEYQVSGLLSEIARLTARAEKAEAALSESQALLAMLHRAITEASEPDFIWGAMDNVNDMDVGLEDFAEAASRAIRAAVPTPADAQAALDARINAAREEGRIAGLREAAEIARGMNNGETAKAILRAILAKIKEAEK